MTAFPRKQPPVDFKTQYSLSFTAQEDEIVVDFFCGGGGAGTGLEMGLGRPVAVAKNHSAKAISMHTATRGATRRSGISALRRKSAYENATSPAFCSLPPLTLPIAFCSS